MGNNFGNLKLSNQNTNSSNLTLGFNDGTVQNILGDISGIINQTDVIVLNNKFATIPFLTNFFYPVIFWDDVTVDDDLNVTGDISYNKTGAKLRKTDNQSITNGEQWNNITWNSEDFDFKDMHNNTANNVTLTIKKDAYYLISYHVKLESNDKTTFNSQIIKNGMMLETLCDTSVGSKEASFVTLKNGGNIFYLENGDELVLQLNHDDVGSSVDLYGNNSYLLAYEQI